MSTAVAEPPDEPDPTPLEQFWVDRIADILSTGRTSWTTGDLIVEVDYTREP